MARVRISWDGCEPVEYDCDRDVMMFLAGYIGCLEDSDMLVETPASRSNRAGELQYAAGLQEDQSHSEPQGHRDQGEQMDIEDLINEGKDNGC